MMASHWAGAKVTRGSREAQLAVKRAAIAAQLHGFTIDPADVALARDWCRRMADDYDLTATPALVLLAILCGYTSGAATARALGMARQTVMNHRTDLYRALGVGNIEGAVGLAWPAYARLRGAAIARYRAQLTTAAA